METQINIQNNKIAHINQNQDLANEILDQENQYRLNHENWLKDLKNEVKDLFKASKKIVIDKENKNNENFLIKLKNLEEKIKDLF